MDNVRRHEAIRTTLMHRARDARDASTVAETTLSIWQQVAARLALIIGGRGVDVLFRRGLHLTSTAFPWLAIAEDHRNSAALLASLKARLAGREPDVAAEASIALLATCTDLLATLIGESLTDSLLGPVWAPRSPPSEQETTS
jgi:hypothetical protein